MKQFAVGQVSSGMAVRYRVLRLQGARWSNEMPELYHQPCLGSSVSWLTLGKLLNFSVPLFPSSTTGLVGISHLQFAIS